MIADTLVLLAAAVLLCAVVVYVARPLWRPPVLAVPPDPRAVALLARREAVLATIRDLDADRADGRLGEAEHAALREAAVGEGAAILAALDRLAASAAGDAAGLAAAIEAEVARHAEAPRSVRGAARDAERGVGDDG